MRTSPNPLSESVRVRVTPAQKQLLQQEYPTLGLSAIIRKLIENHLQGLTKIRQTINEL